MRNVRIAAIVNPVSGAGMDLHAARRRVDMLRDELTRRQLSATIDVTSAAGHARDLARAAVADRADLVIVWGGDGTVNEIGGALAGSPTALGLIPAGSGNGLAGGLGVPRDPRAALATALGDRTLAVDVGMLDDRPFFNIAGIGFDAHIARLFNQRTRGRRGRLPYIVIGVREGCRYVGKDYRITLDGAVQESRALLIAFANGQEYGMGMQIAPGARPRAGIGPPRAADADAAHPEGGGRVRRRDRVPPRRRTGCRPGSPDDYDPAGRVDREGLTGVVRVVCGSTSLPSSGSPPGATTVRGVLRT